MQPDQMTWDEIGEIFGKTMPIDCVTLMQEASHTTDELRAHFKKIGPRHRLKTMLLELVNVVAEDPNAAIDTPEGEGGINELIGAILDRYTPVIP